MQLKPSFENLLNGSLSVNSCVSASNHLTFADLTCFRSWFRNLLQFSKLYSVGCMKGRFISFLKQKCKLCNTQQFSALLARSPLHPLKEKAVHKLRFNPKLRTYVTITRRIFFSSKKAFSVFKHLLRV